MKPKDPSWIRYIKNRIAQNKNFLCFVSGQTGSGKSWSCLSIAQMLQPDFTEKQVVFTLAEFAKLLKDGNLRTGDVIIFEESGVAASAKRAMSKENLQLGFILQTFRHRRFIVFLNSPSFGFLDKTSRILMHGLFETVRINPKSKHCIIKPLALQYNTSYDKQYRKYLRVRTAEGYAPVHRWAIGAPSSDLIEKYEAKKLAFTQQVIADASETFEKPKKELSERQKDVKKALEDGLTIEQTAEKLQIIPRMVYTHITALKKKGYNVTRKLGHSGECTYTISAPV